MIGLLARKSIMGSWYKEELEDEANSKIHSSENILILDGPMRLL